MQILPESPQTIHESVESTIAVPQNEDVMSGMYQCRVMLFNAETIGPAEVQTLEFRPAVDESDETTAAVATVDQTQHAISGMHKCRSITIFLRLKP